MVGPSRRMCWPIVIVLKVTFLRQLHNKAFVPVVWDSFFIPDVLKKVGKNVVLRPAFSICAWVGSIQLLLHSSWLWWQAWFLPQLVGWYCYIGGLWWISWLWLVEFLHLVVFSFFLFTINSGMFVHHLMIWSIWLMEPARQQGGFVIGVGCLTIRRELAHLAPVFTCRTRWQLQKGLEAPTLQHHRTHTSCA